MELAEWGGRGWSAEEPHVKPWFRHVPEAPLGESSGGRALPVPCFAWFGLFQACSTRVRGEAAGGLDLFVNFNHTVDLHR
eukprot:81434-Karenia_brevis.AAC.1